MAATIAIVGAFLAFVVPTAVPLFARTWRGLGVIALVALGFFSWMAYLQTDANGGSSSIGTFLGGTMLIGFAFGAIAKFAMLIDRKRTGDEGPAG